MSAFVRALSFSSLALAIGAFLLCLSVISTLSGFALERALSKRRIFAMPLFEQQYRFELLGNAVLVTVISLSLALGLKLDFARFCTTEPLAATVTFFAMGLAFQG